jgi:uncharacterized protein
MNTIGYFEIQSSDPAREIRFYESIFSWKFVKEAHAPVEYYRIETNGMHGGLLKRQAAAPPPECGANAFVNSIQVESFDKAAALILKNGGTIALPKFAVPGRCWQGYFLDTDHNTFGVFEVDANAK